MTMPSGRSRALLATIVLVGSLLCIELVNLLVLRLVTGGWTADAGISRQALADEPSVVVEPDVDEPEAPTWMLGQREAHAVHPYLGYVVEPDPENGRYRRYEDGPASLGFPRSRAPLAFAPSPDHVVVGIVGGSVAQQIGARGQILAAKLGELDRFATRTVSVVNVAVAGYKQPQQLLTVAYLTSIGVHFDVIINVDGLNEVVLPIKDNLAFETNPFYPRNWRFKVQALDDEVLIARLDLDRRSSRRRSIAHAFDQAPWRWSPTANVIWYLADRAAADRVASAEQEVIDVTVARETSLQSVGPSFDVPDRDRFLDDLVEAWIRGSEQIHSLSRGRFEYLHVLQPNQYLDGSKPLTPEERRTAYQADGPFAEIVPDAYPKLLARGLKARDEGLPFRDFTGIFRDVEETLYIDRCCHLNKTGTVLLIDAIVEALREPPLAGDPSR